MAKQNIVQSTIRRINTYQQAHSWLGFPYAVIKKYGDDDGGYQSAIITYYGFLSLFPLLMVAVSLLDIFASNNPDLQQNILRSIGHYFPGISTQLQSSIQASSKTGAALIIGLLLAFIGARGGADALRAALDHIWHVPKAARANFPKGPLKSLEIIAVGGAGLLLSAYAATYITGFGQSDVLKVVAGMCSLLLLVITLCAVLSIAMSESRSQQKSKLITATIGAGGIFIIQNFGTYLLTNQLKSFSSLYGTFALVLGLLFWIYLQVQVLLFAVEIGMVAELRLWPRSLSDDLTDADKQVYKSLAHKEKVQPREKVKVKI